MSFWCAISDMVANTTIYVIRCNYQKGGPESQGINVIHFVLAYRQAGCC